MNNKLFRLAILFLYVLTTNAVAANYVSSVNAYQEGKNIVITYQLSKRSNISVYVSTDGGKKYSSIKNISGDFGKNVSSGAKRIIWNVLADYEEFNFPEVCFMVLSFNAESVKNNGHEYVDLGLPSGTKWATCNVGATTPEGYGNYYAWGETTTKSIYNWSNYKWCNGSYSSMTKYCTLSYYGTVDNKTTLDLSDDAAYVNWGSSWRMPTKAEQDELRNTSYTTWTWITQNEVNGYIVTSKTNGNSIFLPVAGYCSDSDLRSTGSDGLYWSSSLYSSSPSGAYGLSFRSDVVYRGDYDRYHGRSVRAVLRVEEP